MTKKETSIKDTIKNIEKQFGEGSILLLGDAKIPDIDVISTGSLKLDQALGAKGYPKGRIVEIYGPESSGKTTLTLHAAIECQKAGGRVAFVDAEQALDLQYAKLLGINVDELTYAQPDHGEQALEIVEALTRTGEFDMIIVDSVAALVPRAEVEGEIGDAHMGLQARMMSQAMRKLTDPIKKTNTCVIFINQIRHKIGVIFGSPETTTGGNALKFYASVRLDVRKRKPIKINDEIIGNLTSVKVVKNKVGPPLRQVEFDLIYGKGIDNLGEVVELSVLHNIVDKNGSWYSYNDAKLGQGLEKTKAFLEENPDTFDEINTQLLSVLK